MFVRYSCEDIETMRTFAIVCLLLIPFSAYAGDGSNGSYLSNDPVVYNVEPSPEEVEEYWTPERIRNARPMPMPSIDGGSVEVPFGDCSEGNCPVAGNGEPGVAEGAVSGEADPGIWQPMEP